MILNNRTITNVTLFLIAGALLVAVAQGGPARLSSQPAALIEQPPADTSGPPAGGGEVDTVPPIWERLLVYVFLIWALALGVEAGVELIRRILRIWLPKEPEPTEILKALNPWLPKPAATLPKLAAISQEPESKDAGAGNPGDSANGNEPMLVGEQEKALRGVASYLKGEKIEKIGDWMEIFHVLALKQQVYLDSADEHLRLNRAVSLGVGIVFASITGVNSFSILLGSDIEGQKAFSQLFSVASGIDWYKLGGILLSAFAATAGSAVWHDLLDKLRQSKEPGAASGQGG